MRAQHDARARRAAVAERIHTWLGTHGPQLAATSHNGTGRQLTTVIPGVFVPCPTSFLHESYTAAVVCMVRYRPAARFELR
jgi:hypothetical protein